jgi:hypothetical protein
MHGRNYNRGIQNVMNQTIFSRTALAVTVFALACGCATDSGPATARAAEKITSFVPLFPKDGVPQGWRVGAWNDVSKPAEGNPQWMVKDGVLHGSEPRGSWLMSEKEYGDFILEYEFKLGERGNSGCALRAPMKGDPAFDGMELQMADFRYNTAAKDSELTGGLYRALAPTKQVYKPTDWNSYHIELRGSRIKVVLNGETVQDTDLSAYGESVKRHDDTPATGLKERPRKGHLGFQELSRSEREGEKRAGDHVMIRNARIKVLD